MDQLQEALLTIQERNARVETEKAWEVSWVRRLSITVVTFVITFAYMKLTKQEPLWLGSFVPAFGYLISTFSIPYMKEFWVNHCYKKHDKQA